jgi:hypothetical protein
MKQLSMLSVAMTLALPLLCGARPATAADLKVIAQAVGENDPLTVSWLDNADGSLVISDLLSGVIHDLFAGIQYVLTEDGQLLLRRLKGNEVSLILPAAAQVHNQKKTLFLIHMRSKDRTRFLDGSVNRFESNPSKGYAEFTLLEVLENGITASTHIEQDLVFANSGPDLDVKSGGAPVPTE